jgi:hypothetical protein
MTVAKTIYSGVAVILIAGLIMGSVDVYSQVQANTKHIRDSKEGEMYEILIEIKANQEFLIKRYDSEVNQ